MLANSSARPMRPSGMSFTSPGDVVGERHALALGRLHVLVGLDQPDQQRVDQNVVRRALARRAPW